MNFKKFADRMNISAEDLAKMGGVTLSCAYTWLSGRNVPKYETIITLLQNGMRLDELFDEKVLECVSNTHRGDFAAIETAAPLREQIVLGQVSAVAQSLASNTASLQSSIASIQSVLSGITKCVVPNSSVCPGWGNVTITPATSTTSTT